MQFKNREDAGKQLAQKLLTYKNHPNTVVIGLPRGGVVVAKKVASLLNLPLDIMVPRKIGAPFNEELAVGAVTQDGHVVWNEYVMRAHNLSPSDVAGAIEKEKKESARRLKAYRGDKPPLFLKDKTVIIIDDGIATGATMRAAIASARAQGALHIILGTPVIADDTVATFEPLVDEIVAVSIPTIFFGVGGFYDSFPQTSDEEVISLLQ